MAVIPFQSNTILIENYLQNQCQNCLKHDLNKSRQNCQKQKKKDFFPVTLKAPISDTNPNKIKLRKLHVRLKFKQLKEKIQSTQRELKINNHKVDNELNEDFIEIISSNSEKFFLGITETPVHFAFFLNSLPYHHYSFLFMYSCKIPFCIEGTTQFQQNKKNSYNQNEVFEKIC